MSSNAVSADTYSPMFPREAPLLRQLVDLGAWERPVEAYTISLIAPCHLNSECSDDWPALPVTVQQSPSTTLTLAM